MGQLSCAHVYVCVCVQSFDKHGYGGWANPFLSWGKPFGLGGANKNEKEGEGGSSGRWIVQNECSGPSNGQNFVNAIGEGK